jgi:hypothetical protein
MHLAAAAGLLLALAAAGEATRPPGAPPRTPTAPTADRRTGLAEVPLRSLTAAAARADRAELARWAERLGPARLAALLAGGGKPEVLAALESLPALQGGGRLLAPVARLLWSEDLEIAQAAARAGGKLLGSERPASVEDWEIAPDEVATACAGIAHLCDATGAPLSLRMTALEALGEAHAFCRGGSAALGALLADVWPEIRRAAVMTPQIARARGADRMGELLADPVPQVASAAGALWCRERLPALRAAAPSEEARRRFARIRTLVLMDVTPVEDAVEMLPCLALSRDPQDRHALEVLRGRRGTPLGERARELGQ